MNCAMQTHGKSLISFSIYLKKLAAWFGFIDNRSATGPGMTSPVANLYQKAMCRPHWRRTSWTWSAIIRVTLQTLWQSLSNQPPDVKFTVSWHDAASATSAILREQYFAGVLRELEFAGRAPKK